jgi:hypothetical protein
MASTTYCSPAAAHGVEPEHQFAGRPTFAVSGHAEADGEFVTTGLAFEDYKRMQTFSKKPTPRRKPVPSYATNPDDMRRLLVRFLEIRAFGALVECRRGPLPGSDAYRLRRAHMRLLDDVPRLDALAEKLCHRYVEGKRNGMSAAELRSLEIEIEGTDSLSIIASRTPEIVLGVIYRSYCCHENSVVVGERLGLKPPSVRALLHRISKVWSRMQIENAPPSAVGSLPKESPERLEQRRKTSSKWYSSLTEEERSARMDRNVAQRRVRASQACSV